MSERNFIKLRVHELSWVQRKNWDENIAVRRYRADSKRSNALVTAGDQKH